MKDEVAGIKDNRKIGHERNNPAVDACAFNADAN
jgi:hypothetical protein